VTSGDESTELSTFIVIQNEAQKCIGGQLSGIFSLLKAFTVLKLIPETIITLSANQGEYIHITNNIDNQLDAAITVY
jgi:hypothetical protein